MNTLSIVIFFSWLDFRKLSDDIGYFIHRLNQFKLIFINKIFQNFFLIFIFFINP